MIDEDSVNDDQENRARAREVRDKQTLYLKLTNSSTLSKLHFIKAVSGLIVSCGVTKRQQSCLLRGNKEMIRFERHVAPDVLALSFKLN